MKYCDEYAALLDLYVDGELTAEGMGRVQDHLEACPACQSYVDDTMAIRAAFPNVEDVEVPEGFAESIMSAIRTEAVSQAKAIPGKKKRNPWLKTLVPLAACCAIVILLQNGLSGGGKAESDNAAAPAAAFDTAATAVASQSAPAEEPMMEAAVETAEEKQASDENWKDMEDSFQPSAQMELFTTNEARMANDYSADTTSEAAADATYATDIAETGTVTNASGGTAADAGVQELPSSEDASEEDTQAATSDLSKYYGAILRLTAVEAGDLLAEHVPVTETETELHYELTEPEYQALLDALPDEISMSAAVSNTGGALVIVQR